VSQPVEELSISQFDDGQEIVQEIDKVILSKGAWATILFRYREWNRTKEAYGEDKYGIRRYQKRNGEYRQQSKFNISNKTQARLISEGLQQWINDSESKS